MYIVVVALTMLILPIVSIAIDLGIHSGASPVIFSIGRWFVFWGVGVRLLLAGARQTLQPSFTAREIFHTTSDQVLPVVRELGLANFSASVVALLSLAIPSFVLPAAVSGAIFYGAAGVLHIAEPNRSRNENIAMGSDLGMAAVLIVFVVARGLT
jgi:hypothetical protein